MFSEVSKKLHFSEKYIYYNARLAHRTLELAIITSCPTERA